MGVGSKPFLDIQPSDAAISDRAVHYIMKSRGTALTSGFHGDGFNQHCPEFGPVQAKHQSRFCQKLVDGSQKICAVTSSR